MHLKLKGLFQWDNSHSLWVEITNAVRKWFYFGIVDSQLNTMCMSYVAAFPLLLQSDAIFPHQISGTYSVTLFGKLVSYTRFRIFIGTLPWPLYNSSPRLPENDVIPSYFRVTAGIFFHYSSKGSILLYLMYSLFSYLYSLWFKFSVYPSIAFQHSPPTFGIQCSGSGLSNRVFW